MDCWGIGIDIAAGGVPAGGGAQEAFASVLDWVDGADRLRIYRIVLHHDLSLEVFLDPWNDEGVPYDGSAMRVNGLDYDSTGTQPFGVFQTTSVVRDLSDGESSCTLPGHPTDVAVWGPGSGMLNPNFHFVTAVTPVGSDFVLGFPAGGCPDGGAASLSYATDHVPRALALSSLTSNTPWVYAAHKNGLITGLQVAFSSDQIEGDRIDLLQSLSIPVSGGPGAVAIRDETYDQCSPLHLIEIVHEARPPRVDCDEDPEDPRCKNLQVAQPSQGGFD
jgi:hypothetical protein